MPAINTDRIDDAVLALMYLGMHDEGRTCKVFDWEALSRLHQKGLISDPVGKAKSVWLTDEAQARSRVLFEKLFGTE